MAIDFYRAAREGHSDTLRVITKRDANKASEDGMTPVHWAASYGNLEALRILMRKGGDPDKPNNDGMTSVHLAASTGQLPCLVFLTNFGANIYAVDDNGNSPLQEASNRGRMECIRHLESIITHQITVDKNRIEKIQAKAKRDAENRVREKARVRRKLDREWEKKVEKQRRAAMAAEVKLKRKGKLSQHDFAQYKRETDSLGSESDSVDRKKLFSELIGIRSDTESTDYSSPRSKTTSPDELTFSLTSFNTDPGNYAMLGNGHANTNGYVSKISEDIVFGKRDNNDLESTYPFIKKNGHTKTNGVLNGNAPRANGRLHTSMNGRLGNVTSRSHMRRKPSHHDPSQAHFSTLATFLNSLALDEFRELFVKEKIDLRAVSLCNESDLKEIGLPLGPRKKILDAIKKRDDAVSNPEDELQDTLV